MKTAGYTYLILISLVALLLCCSVPLSNCWSPPQRNKEPVGKVTFRVYRVNIKAGGNIEELLDSQVLSLTHTQDAKHILIKMKRKSDGQEVIQTIKRGGGSNKGNILISSSQETKGKPKNYDEASVLLNLLNYGEHLPLNNDPNRCFIFTIDERNALEKSSDKYKEVLFNHSFGTHLFRSKYDPKTGQLWIEELDKIEVGEALRNDPVFRKYTQTILENIFQFNDRELRASNPKGIGSESTGIAVLKTHKKELYKLISQLPSKEYAIPEKSKVVYTGPLKSYFAFFLDKGFNALVDTGSEALCFAAELIVNTDSPISPI